MKFNLIYSARVSTPHHRTTIYVVDDDLSVRRAIQRVLASAGYRSEVFESADELLALENFETPACVVADFRMAGGSGLELKQRLTDRGSTMPLILITALDTKEMRQKARDAGVAGYLRKPVDDQALIDAIEWGLSKS